jgi:hypothetical protein
MRALLTVGLLLLGCDDSSEDKRSMDLPDGMKPVDGGKPIDRPVQLDSGKSGDSGIMHPSGLPLGMIQMVPNVVAGSHLGDGTPGQSQSALRIGSPSATDLKSLKYYIISIQLCEEVDVMGSGYSGSRGCVQLYEKMDADSPDYNTYLVTQAKDDETPGRFIDLMTAAGQAALRRPVTLEVPVSPTGTVIVDPVPQPDADAGVDADGGTGTETEGAVAYRFGLINFYRPIKVTAEFPVLGGEDYFRTKAITYINSDPAAPGGLASERVEIGNTLEGATEETTYMLNNGGVLFTFQKPFVITQDDIDSQTQIKIDLVFNPENFGQAFEANDCTTQPYISICDPTNDVVIDMPFVRMSPVPRKAGEKTRKETYLMNYEPGAKLRIELYYNDADEEAGIQGVDTAIVYDQTATTPYNNVIASNFVSQSGSVTSDDASVQLKDYQYQVNLEGLVRRHDGTATIHCLFTGSLCPSLGGTVTRAYTYEGDDVVSTD